MKQKGITLIGMPASGKSTIGRQLSKALDLPLLDIDSEMEQREGMPMREIIANRGAEATLDVETNFIRSQNLYKTIVSTPGSIVYNDVLDILREQTHIVWLNVPKQTIAKRLDADIEPKRQIIGLEQKGFDVLFSERTRLYKEWATYTIDCQGKDVAGIVREIIKVIIR